jgi:hypothetical protein
MKKLETNWIVIFHFPIEKAKMNAPRLWKKCHTAHGTGQGATLFVRLF